MYEPNTSREFRRQRTRRELYVMPSTKTLKTIRNNDRYKDFADSREGDGEGISVLDMAAKFRKRNNS
jgi:hypothetical protein